MAMPLRPCRDLGDGATRSLRFLVPFYIKSTVELVYVQLNVNRIVVVTMLQLANMIHRRIILDDEVKARQRKWGWD